MALDYRAHLALLDLQEKSSTGHQATWATKNPGCGVWTCKPHKWISFSLQIDGAVGSVGPQVCFYTTTTTWLTVKFRQLLYARDMAAFTLRPKCTRHKPGCWVGRCPDFSVMFSVSISGFEKWEKHGLAWALVTTARVKYESMIKAFGRCRLGRNVAFGTNLCQATAGPGWSQHS